MTTRSPALLRSLAWFGAGAVLLTGAEAAIVHSVAFARRPDWLAPAVVADLALGLPLLYYFLLVRPLRLRPTTVVGVAALALGVAATLLPAAQRHFVLTIRYALAPLEVLTVGYALWQLRAIRRHYCALAAGSPDFILNLTASLRAVLGAAGPLLAGEVALVRYGLLGWWGGREATPDARVFTQYHASGQVALVSVLIGVGLLETVGTHLLLGRWSIAAAWTLTAFSLYGLLFFVADLVAVVKRPYTLTATTLHLRAGLRWQVAVPLASICHVVRISEKPARDGQTVNLAFVTAPNLLLTLTESLTALGPYGLTRAATRIAFFADASDELLAVLGRQ